MSLFVSLLWQPAKLQSHCHIRSHHFEWLMPYTIYMYISMRNIHVNNQIRHRNCCPPCRPTVTTHRPSRRVKADTYSARTKNFVLSPRAARTELRNFVLAALVREFSQLVLATSSGPNFVLVSCPRTVVWLVNSPCFCPAADTTGQSAGPIDLKTPCLPVTNLNNVISVLYLLFAICLLVVLLLLAVQQIAPWR